MIILDGRVVRDTKAKELKKKISEFSAPLALAIIQVGDLSESNTYIKQKEIFAEKIGVKTLRKVFPEAVAPEPLIKEINRLNGDSEIHGIIVQLPIPPHLTRGQIINTISPNKDIDGLTTANKALLEANNNNAVTPATARGVLSLLSFYHIPVSGKKVTVVGRSALVGGPIAVLLKKKGAVVTVCHRQTPNIPEKTRMADIIVVAAGQPRFITKEYVSPGQIVVDVGINSVAGEKFEEEIPKRKIVGDVDFENVSKIVAAISPVPGGVGPMTVLSLFENLAEAGERQKSKRSDL